jgi:hypothetical protein
MEFREYIEQQDFVEFAQNSFNTGANKPWSATKDEIVKAWQQLRPDIPIHIQPIKDSKTSPEHSSFGQDGIRITGTWEFIASILGRIKEILTFENPRTKLRLVFRGTDSRHTTPDRQSFVFYIHLQTRGSGRVGRPKKLKLKPL